MSQFALVRESKAAVRPRQLSAEHAAALPLAGMTALQGLRASGVDLPGSKEWKGEGSFKGRVLVANASGGVGHFAVQVSKRVSVAPCRSCGDCRQGGHDLGVTGNVCFLTPRRFCPCFASSMSSPHPARQDCWRTCHSNSGHKEPELPEASTRGR